MPQAHKLNRRKGLQYPHIFTYRSTYREKPQTKHDRSLALSYGNSMLNPITKSSEQ